jgi:hypothetical protein
MAKKAHPKNKSGKKSDTETEDMPDVDTEDMDDENGEPRRRTGRTGQAGPG